MVSFVRTIQGVRILVETHLDPHADEYAAAWQVERFASVDWLREHCPDGVLRLGIEGGEFDEHEFGGRERRKGECCATLVAKSLGIFERTEMQRILQFVRLADCGELDPKTGQNRSKTAEFDLYNSLKVLFAYYEETKGRQPDVDLSPEGLYKIIGAFLDAHYFKALDFQRGLTDLENAREIEVQTPAGPRLIVAVQTQTKTGIKPAAWKYRNRLEVYVQRNRLTEQILIFRAVNSLVSLEDVASTLRLAERKRRGINEIPDHQSLRAEGETVDVPEVYYNRHAEQIYLGGTLTHPDKPRTSLSFSYVVECVVVGIEHYYARHGFRKPQARDA